MSEPMVRVVDAVCPIHGRAQERASGSKAGRDKHGVGFEPWTESAEYVRTHSIYCGTCIDEGAGFTPVAVATEPVDLEPREEQAG